MRTVTLCSAAWLLLLTAIPAHAAPSAPGLVEFKCHVKRDADKGRIVFVEAKNAPHAKFLLLEKATYEATNHAPRKKENAAAPAALPQVLECRPLAETFSSSEAQALDLATPR